MTPLIIIGALLLIIVIVVTVLFLPCSFVVEYSDTLHIFLKFLFGENTNTSTNPPHQYHSINQYFRLNKTLLQYIQ